MKVSAECVSVYNELRLSRKYRYIIYSLNSDNTEIVVERKVERGAAHSDAFKEFCESLPTADYRFAVFDFQEQLDGNGWDDKICFFRWYVSFILYNPLSFVPVGQWAVLIIRIYAGEL